MIEIIHSDKPAHLGETRERSGKPVNLAQPTRALKRIGIDSVGVTRSAKTLFAVIEFDTRETLEPDIDTPRTIADMAEEQRRFTADLEGYVDVDLPLDN